MSRQSNRTTRDKKMNLSSLLSHMGPWSPSCVRTTRMTKKSTNSWTRWGTILE
uniref:Uncharacterized protein n=1 Tax=Anguilla anguilla TaxID=7936 RepID=A0A0E9SF05_ANGAN